MRSPKRLMSASLYDRGEPWPTRVDLHLAEVDRWVRSASILHSNGGRSERLPRGRRAQPRVSVEVVGADPGAGDDGQRVVLLEEELTRGVEAERGRAGAGEQILRACDEYTAPKEEPSDEFPLSSRCLRSAPRVTKLEPAGGRVSPAPTTAASAPVGPWPEPTRGGEAAMVVEDA